MSEHFVTRSWRARTGVRVRITVVAVLVVGVTLAVAGLVFLVVAGNRIEAAIEDRAVTRAVTLGALAEADLLSGELPGADPELYAQVVTGPTVLASDEAIGGAPPLSDLRPATGERVTLEVDDLLEATEEDLPQFEDEGPYVVVAFGVELSDGAGAVLVAASLEDAREALEAFRPLLGIGLPLLLAVVAVTTWILTGRALRPVEQMRLEADRISAAAMGVRLPLPEATDEVHRLAVTLNEMLDRLEAAAVKQRRFVSDASHELKSPLAALRAMVDVAARTPDDIDTVELLADLGSELSRMERLVSDMLYLARSDESEPPLSTEDVDLDHVAAVEAQRVRQHSELAVDTTGIHPARISADPGRIEQLVRNLTSNALRHAVHGVWVETGARGGMAYVAVSDDGGGVDPAERERVFERFVRLDEARDRQSGGSGLGLAVARAIARAHGGELELVGSRHGGATFEATLPSADDV